MWRYLSCCFDKRVLIGAGPVFAVIGLVAPHQAVAALPVLTAFVCPVSMLVMMRATNRSGGQPDESARDAEIRKLLAEIEELMAARRPADPETGDDMARDHPGAVGHRRAAAGGER